MEEMSYVFSFTFFTAAHFHLAFDWWPLAFLIFLSPLQNFDVVLPTKKCLLFLNSRSRSLSHYFLLSLADLPPTFSFLCLSFAPYSKFVDMTVNLSLILQTTRIQKQFPLSVIVFIDSLAVSALQDAPGSYAISRQNNLELLLGCHWLPYLSIELFYIGLPVVRTGGRVGGRAGVRSRDCQIFSDG